jgi:hypothetical protein
MADFLEQLLNDGIRAKVLRFALLHPNEAITPSSAGNALHIPPLKVAVELNFFAKLGLLKKKVKPKSWTVDTEFKYFIPLRTFVSETAPGKREEVLRALKKVGKMHCIIIGGVFSDDSTTALDITLIGDKFDDKKLAVALRSLESFVGSELRYATFTIQEFRYRKAVNDRLIRDIIERPHQVLLDTLGLFALEPRKLRAKSYPQT